MKTYITLLLTGALLLPVKARIEETQKQLVARYGDPVSVNQEKRTLTFLIGGMDVVAIIRDDAAEIIIFRLTEANILGQHTKLTDNQIAAILKANGNGREWVTKPGEIFMDIWATSDNHLVAKYDKLDGTLCIFTFKALTIIGEERKAKETKQLDGF